jgi:ATP-binding cassette subfamily C protein CydCD
VAAATGAFAWLDAPTPPTGTRRPPAGSIRLDRVSVRYPDRAAPALAGCDLRLDPGEVVALTGPSGCGKSTVLHALLGFVRPAGGRIEVGGIDLGEVDLAWWRSQVAWVPQRAHLFPGTVAQNIALGDPVTPDDRVADAARAAGIEHLLTRVVDSGLSTGERQRVALARAFLRDAPVVLLDEPTANLDGAAEAALIESVRTLCRGRTVLLVAHRPALLDLPDRVVDLTRSPEEVPA